MTKKFIERQRFGLDDVVGGRTLSPYTTSNKQKEKETLIKRSVVYEQIDKKKE